MKSNYIAEGVEAIPVWIAFSNTDCNEGRGVIYPLHVCATEATAIRMGKKKYIQGTDCPVKEGTALLFDGSLYIPGKIHSSTREDEAAQKLIDEASAKLEAKRLAIEKAKALGLSEDDIEALKN